MGEGYLDNGEIGAKAGNQLTDEDTVTIVNPTTATTSTFDFDLGYILTVTQTGAAIPDGTNFTVNGTTFQLSTDGNYGGNTGIAITANESAAQVASAISNALASIGVTTNFDATGDKIEMSAAAASVTLGAGVTALTLDTPPAAPANGSLINVNYTMSVGAVATALATAINNYSSTANDAELNGSTVTIVTGSTTATVTTTLPYSDTLPGDIYGDINSAARNTTNNFEGVYLDNIIIGLAGRGEMVTDPTPLSQAAMAATGAYSLSSVPANSSSNAEFNLPTDPSFTKTNYTGTYQLEIQRGSEFSLQESASQSLINLNQTFNINDRQTQGYSLTASTGSQISDGEEFSISDGVHSVTFMYSSTGAINSGSMANNNLVVVIPFTASQSAASIATSMVAAINSVSASSPALSSAAVPGLAVEAGTVGIGYDDTSTLQSAGPQVNLFGAVQVLNSLTIVPQSGSTDKWSNLPAQR